MRKNNEDSFVALQFDAHELRYLGKVGEETSEHNDFVFAVSDGMGGAMAGEFASRITVDKIAHLLPRSYKQSETVGARMPALPMCSRNCSIRSIAR